jgi:predicted peptidase
VRQLAAALDCGSSLPPRWQATAIRRRRRAAALLEIVMKPVILFLHGAGERGTDGVRQRETGLGPALREHPREAIVVFPQLPPDAQWLDQHADAAMQQLDEAIAAHDGDPRRVYLTGISLGGFGVWHLALAHPDRFAALVPICGGIAPAGSAESVRQSPLTEYALDPYAFTAHALRDIPIWMFHGADDTVIEPGESRTMQAALLRENAKDVRYTEYEGVGHNSWTRAYAEPELWRWMFAQRQRN